MYQHGLPALHGLVIWWVSTCLILFLDSLPRQTFRWSMTVATAILAGAIYGLRQSAMDFNRRRRIYRLHLWRADLGLAGDQLLHGILDRTKNRSLRPWM